VFDTNVIKLAQPGVFTDSLTEILRSGARAVLPPFCAVKFLRLMRSTFAVPLAPVRPDYGRLRSPRHTGTLERSSSITAYISGRCAACMGMAMRIKRLPRVGDADSVPAATRAALAGRLALSRASTARTSIVIC
jgi:hypothetical protein